MQVSPLGKAQMVGCIAGSGAAEQEEEKIPTSPGIEEQERWRAPSVTMRRRMQARAASDESASPSAPPRKRRLVDSEAVRHQDFPDSCRAQRGMSSKASLASQSHKQKLIPSSLPTQPKALAPLQCSPLQVRVPSMNVEAGAREDAAASASGSRGACIGSSADKWRAQSRPSQSKQHSGLVCQDAGG